MRNVGNQFFIHSRLVKFEIKPRNLYCAPQFTFVFGVSYQTIYTYTDENVHENQTYDYRLADVDYDGNVEYHTTQLMGLTMSSTIPEEYRLYQNYPNPFNPEITIPIFIKSAGHGHHLSIYNLAGKEVAYFDIGHLAQGKHEYKWRPSKNTKIASGIFFIQLNTPDGINTRKIIYLK